ncbi:8-amino-7-oxononanoate synthase [Aneurinibacillus migulanus]|uniref:8-amino-7-ketopelargonate synthase n=1 Tax=Aneurinibacillus migulanus TaxID=47500 RepID=A0A0D1WNF2_ANEMI|nr:8-amino-7-oxononanoate synthase [Aneurinibacillus migulanus]KIV60200.1 8-amino-7-oxononanoate synthase [Aneurinibacillus migulanus]KON97260.1 8-amino-7-oxononanoate synthase [Aneurinibacillus migulanus]MED0895864.1 8-amino-7-oxononanoate synthase [Aneurinibacillus migulanus]MED1618849.1 8-amino-7-oxononanoate synthase [Aneurinibacillus migulanus]SDJ54268.1 8-amino-7-oxononanoate synthase [Aneurinibacillus migulanus]
MDEFEASLCLALETKKEKGLLRHMRTVEENNEINIFSSNNYLGLARDERVRQAAIQAIEAYGTGSGGSRLTTGNLSLHERLESVLAAWKGKEDAILFSSGYLANLGTISALMMSGDTIFSDELNHASIIDGCRMSRARTVIYRHADMRDLELKLCNAAPEGKKLIVTDGVFSMDGNIAPLPEITQLASVYGAWVMVDDAHATGILGETGAGTAEYFGVSDGVHLAMGTLSKSIGTEGGYVAASANVIQYLRNYARPFIFQTSLSPGVIGAALKAVEIIQTEPVYRQRVMANAEYMRTGLRKLGYRLIEGTTPILAVVIGEAKRAVEVSRCLEGHGVFAPAIRPPTVPEGTSRIRVTLSAVHTRDEMDRALAAFAAASNEI